MSYTMPAVAKPPKAGKKDVLLVASGDLRLSANQNCWAAQQEMETALGEAVAACGYRVVRAHPYKADERHGFIGSQKEGMAVFAQIDPEGPSDRGRGGLAVFASRVARADDPQRADPDRRQLVRHLARTGRHAQSQRFADQGRCALFHAVVRGFRATRRFGGTWRAGWKRGRCGTRPITSRRWPMSKVPGSERRLGESLAAQLQREKAIMGVFDEGCMGMFNAIIPDHLLNPTGVFKERLSQSALYYETTQVSDEEAREVRRWMEERGMTFVTGPRSRNAT